MRTLALRRLSLPCAAGLLAGCYTYTPLPLPLPLQTPDPAPQQRVALVLTDQGRVGAGPLIGSGVARVDGALVGSTDSDFTLQVAGVTDLRGTLSRWSGETITLRRSWVGNAYERRFSKSRTYLLAGALTAGFVAFVATRHLFGIGGGGTETPPPGGGQQ